MIVRRGERVVHLITQPDHAALARRIMEHCTPLARSQRCASILHAIGEHDNGWRELDDHPTIDGSGRVVDFINTATGPKQAVWPRGVARLADSPVAAALVAHHAVTVYDRFRRDPEWSAFFPELETTRDRLLQAAGLSYEELLRDYVYVRLGDLISLTFCTGWSDEQKYEGWSVQRGDDSSVVVRPDAFDVSEIAIEVPALELADRTFRSESEFRDALAAAARVTLAGSVTTEPWNPEP